jgi:hypothetical protein
MHKEGGGMRKKEKDCPLPTSGSSLPKKSDKEEEKSVYWKNYFGFGAAFDALFPALHYYYCCYMYRSVVQHERCRIRILCQQSTKRPFIFPDQFCKDVKRPPFVL